MFKKKSWIIVTDLDASLMDANYSYEAAQEALDLIHQKQIPLILNSSKTLSELIAISENCNWQSKPFLIGENGACLGIPKSHPMSEQIQAKKEKKDYYCVYDKGAYARILKHAKELKLSYNYHFVGFSDLSNTELCTLTGLTPKEADRAKERLCTEPIVWKDSEEAFLQFSSQLKSRGIQSIRGGQFIHLMEDTHDKSTGMEAVLAIFKSVDPDTEWETLAIGDSANDIPMLEHAKHALIIPNLSNGTLQLKRKDFFLANAPATSGWNEGVLKILNINP